MFDSSRYAMTAAAWPAIAVGLLTVLLGAAVIVRERGSRVSWTFGVVTWMVALWLLAVGVSYTAREAELARRWILLEHVGVVCIPTAVLLFAATVVRQAYACRLVMALSGILSVCFYAAILLTDGFISGLIHYPWGWYPRYGPVSLPFLVFFFVVLLFSLGLLWQAYRRSRMRTARRRFRALLMAFSIGYVGSVDYLAAYGVPVYPFGYAPVFGFLVVAAYSIWRYHLVDITPAFAAAQIIETMIDGLLVLDREGIIRVANASAQRVFARAQTADLVGQPIATMWGSLLTSRDLEGLLHGAMRDYETTLITREGEEIVLSLSASAMRDASGERIAIVCLARDITTRVKMQRALSQAHAQLEQRVQERTADLTKANAMLKTTLAQRKEIEDALRQARDELEQRVRERTVELNRQRLAALNLAQDAMEAKQSAERATQELRAAQLQLVQAAKLESVGRLAAGVAHEVKNPLATILIGLEHLQDHFAVSDQEVQGLLKDMTRAVERADHVIRGLLDFSAPNELARKPVEVHGLIEQALELVRHPLTKAHVTVSKAFAQGLPQVPVDAHKMEQVFVNLFLNAMQAMPSGGTLTLATRLDGRAGVIIEITDTGTGIPEDKLPKIFDPFFTTKPAGKGTGLGLCVTKRIVELHGGTVAIGNRPAGGVQVTIALRAEEEPSHGHVRGQEAQVLS